MRKQKTSLIVIILIAVFIRLAVAVYLGDGVDRSLDEYSYSALAARLASGHGYSFDQGWYPFTPAEMPTAHWSFLYTAFVAGIYRMVGVHPLVVRLIQAVMGGILLPWLAHRLARRLFPGRERLGLAAAGCTAVYAFFILYGAQLMTETFYIAALLWSLERAMALAGSASNRRWSWEAALGLGVSLGIATLLRQSILPWVLILFSWMLYSNWLAGERPRVRVAGRRLVCLFFAGIVMLAFILPFTVRNYLVYDEFLLLNSNAGYAMYSAQHPMHGTDFQAFEAAPLPEAMFTEDLNEAEWDKALMAQGLGFILAEPGRYLRLSASRVLDYFEFWPTETSLLHNVGRLISFTIFLPFYISGIWLGIKEWRTTDTSKGRAVRGLRDFSTSSLAMLLLFICFYSLLHIFTWAMPRYRLPVDAVAMPFAALAISEAVAFSRKRLALGRGYIKARAAEELS